MSQALARVTNKWKRKDERVRRLDMSSDDNNESRIDRKVTTSHVFHTWNCSHVVHVPCSFYALLFISQYL